MIVRGTSARLIGQHSRAAIIMFLEIVFRLEARMIKLKAGHGGFLYQCAKAFPANVIFFVPPAPPPAPWLKAILTPRSYLALRSACCASHHSGCAAQLSRLSR
jgi:hypothetical protein